MLSALVLIGILKSVQTAFFYPLSAVPGPWYAALSDLWLTTHVFRFKQTTTLHELFQLYGPIVRVGPNKIVFCDPDVMRDVYLKFMVNGIDQSFVFPPSGPHYTAANIAHFQPEIKTAAIKLVESLESLAATVSVDCLHILRNFVADIVVFSTFGYHLGALEKWTSDVPDDLSVAVSDFPKMGIVQSLFPDWIWNALCYIPHKRWRSFTQCSQILKEFVATRIQEFQHQIDLGKEFDSPPFIYRLLRYRSPTNDALPADVVITESVAHLIAGTETTSTTLSYFLWQISTRSDVMEKLQIEVDNAMPDPRVIPDLGALQNLSYLNAFIQEGFRVHAVVCGLLERVVPATESYNLMGHVLPAETVVGTQTFFMHRDPGVFSSPDTFDPERWLDVSESDSTCRSGHLMPFGAGTRVCAGQQLAQAVIRIALVAIVRDFAIQPGPSTTSGSMKMKHGFASFPTAGECKLIFIPRRD
ncbi:cytochrome P450 [Mycena crocata]|nr:cytochrome P450 [Mycena crocata]